MITANQLRAGMAIRFESEAYKVLAADYHPGQGRMGGVNHARLRNLSTGTLWEHSFRADLRLEELPAERQTLEFLYDDDEYCVFMNPGNYEQVEVPRSVIGEQAHFLETGMKLPVDFVEGRPVGVVFPDVVDVKIEDTQPPTHGQADSAWKPALLANGVEIMVPPFVKTGDAVRINLNELKYMDRARTKSA